MRSVVWLIGEIGYISILKVQNSPGFIRIHYSIHKIYYRKIEKEEIIYGICYYTHLIRATTCTRYIIFVS